MSSLFFSLSLVHVLSLLAIFFPPHHISHSHPFSSGSLLHFPTFFHLHLLSYNPLPPPALFHLHPFSFWLIHSSSSHLPFTSFSSSTSQSYSLPSGSTLPPFPSFKFIFFCFFFCPCFHATVHSNKQSEMGSWRSWDVGAATRGSQEHLLYQPDLFVYLAFLLYSLRLPSLSYPYYLSTLSRSFTS